ncbi:MAG: hypothetical protein A2632_02850 [Candidatus Pacebacteria bacterium RIFCSPHIGHO2_01_FULL_46_16]|nr:MAG: hypothetical protein A2632_02850 [Candidatus Pacebacteria bacterium RIFCSPHIGHO2_01_FULL_46_16]OGJ21167.1 MAG: hypothetical protein A3J60_01285 [Candidatus Pacebacteria bacterium RIFCSPHIGHO2_02_FULL_46_9]OGJ38937.1 MAG: hypothetical protein A3A82_02165 [Candidatus Pacebacteria bacterium RIFCSPLOWO2_01_FULL_47_12]
MNNLILSDFIQLIIAVITLLAVLVALFGNRLWKWFDRPKIIVDFDDNNPEFFHQTEMHIHQNGQIIKSVPTYYIRLKVTNAGKDTLENAEVVLEKVIPQQEKFMSLNLSWAGFISASNDITRTVRIPRKQSRIIDVIEVMKPQETKELAMNLNQNDTDKKRYEAYSKGFRCCSIKPNTLSDIFSNGNYVFHFGVYADNAEPKNFKLSIKYNGNWNSNNRKMANKNLRIKLLS